MAKMEEAMENLLEDEAEGVLTPAEKTNFRPQKGRPDYHYNGIKLSDTEHIHRHLV
jgi:hypothetical protein